MNAPIAALPTEPTNVIFTGVAGTGKTYRLLELQKRYDDSIAVCWDSWRIQQISHYGWCDVVCAVLLLEDRLMTVPEMMQHPLIIDKAAANKRNENINQTLWVQLNTHTHPDSTTVNSAQRSANYYFDKTETSQWYLLDELKPILTEQLSELLSLYDDSARHHYHQTHTVSRSCLVSFHQSYGYDEFVEGIRPRINAQTGQMQYEIQQGAFLALCAKAASDPEHRYAMLIDEINRANTAQVFGELMSVIEPSKRAGGATPMSVRLAYSGRQFMVPSNVDIYATMNTQDHSLAVLDMAFRRRFDFVTCYPDASLLSVLKDDAGKEVDLAQMMLSINQRLTTLCGEQAQLGQSYFMGIDDIRQLAKRLYRQIVPQIMAFISLHRGEAYLLQSLHQILYGDNSVSYSLLYHPDALNYAADEPHASLFAAEAYEQPHSAESGLFAQAFVAVAENPSLSLESQSIYLTAAPYQQLYSVSSEDPYDAH